MLQYNSTYLSSLKCSVSALHRHTAHHLVPVSLPYCTCALCCLLSWRSKVHLIRPQTPVTWHSWVNRHTGPARPTSFLPAPLQCTCWFPHLHWFFFICYLRSVAMHRRAATGCTGITGVRTVQPLGEVVWVVNFMLRHFVGPFLRILDLWHPSVVFASHGCDSPLCLIPTIKQMSVREWIVNGRCLFCHWKPD